MSELFGLSQSLRKRREFTQNVDSVLIGLGLGYIE